ncbi:MAG: glutamine amidotransferase family protein [bacterium]|nr:MAG: glutamine amidotransferase family protein [bacterium]
MKDLSKVNNPYNDEKVISQCSIFGMMSTVGELFSGKAIITAVANMHDRGNGLGGGFAIYGCYPDRSEDYCLQIMFNTRVSREETEVYLKRFFHINHAEEIPTFPTKAIKNPPDVWRYFVQPKLEELHEIISEDDVVTRRVFTINTTLEGAYVFSSGKNMGVFKGVGFPEEIAEYFGLEHYQGYIWTAHGRFPTNTQGWWGGAHPFSLLDWTVVHNGEISSYGANRRFLEMYDYVCSMHTDTEVVAYAVDLLARRHGLPVEVVMDIFSPPVWEQIDRMGPEERVYFEALRNTYGPLLLNGPFAIIVAHHGEMVAHTDRIRLRPMVAGIRGDMVYASSEESAIRLVSPQLDRVWIPVGGHPIIARIKDTPGQEVVKGGRELDKGEKAEEFPTC